jgi:5,10-methylenetetrahydromethanopterin reductase
MKTCSFGIGFEASPVKQMIQHAQLAEASGFGMCWVSEDYFWRGAFSLASTLAAHTKRMRIGIGAINPFTRNPALTAMETAAFAEAAGPERAIVAMGASGKLWMDQMGIPYGKPRKSLQEAVYIVQAMLRGEGVTFQGEQFQATNIKFAYAPVTPASIYLGVIGPKNLELCGEVADGLLLSLLTSPQYVRYAVERVRAGASKKGRSLEDFDIQAYLIISIDKDRQRAREAVRRFCGTMIGYGGMFFADPILTCTGMTMEQIQPICQAVMSGQDPGPLVTDWMLDTFTISGTPEECQERLRLLFEAGLTAPVAFEIPGTDFGDTIQKIREHLFPIAQAAWT